MICFMYIIYYEYVCKEQDDSLYMEEYIEEWVVFFYDYILISD